MSIDVRNAPHAIRLRFDRGAVFFESRVPCATIADMTELLEVAIERLKELPQGRQDQIAAALIAVTEGDDQIDQ
jgi:hypothetical protein